MQIRNMGAFGSVSALANAASLRPRRRVSHSAARKTEGKEIGVVAAPLSKAHQLPVPNLQLPRRTITRRTWELGVGSWAFAEVPTTS